MNVLDTLATSQASLFQSFIELMEETPYAAIRVRHITERSGLGRTTFYLHFKCKEDLLQQLEELLAEGFLQKAREVRRLRSDDFRQKIESGYHPGFASYFEYLRDNAQAFTVLFKPQEGVTLTDRLIDGFMGFGIDHLNPGGPISRIKNAVYQTIVAQYIQLFITWVTIGMVVPIDAMVSMVTSIWKGYVYDEHSVVRYIMRLSDENEQKQT